MLKSKNRDTEARRTCSCLRRELSLRRPLSPLPPPLLRLKQRKRARRSLTKKWSKSSINANNNKSKSKRSNRRKVLQSPRQPHRPSRPRLRPLRYHHYSITRLELHRLRPHLPQRTSRDKLPQRLPSPLPLHAHCPPPPLRKERSSRRQ